MANPGSAGFPACRSGFPNLRAVSFQPRIRTCLRPSFQGGPSRAATPFACGAGTWWRGPAHRRANVFVPGVDAVKKLFHENISLRHNRLRKTCSPLTTRFSGNLPYAFRFMGHHPQIKARAGPHPPPASVPSRLNIIVIVILTLPTPVSEKDPGLRKLVIAHK